MRIVSESAAGGEPSAAHYEKGTEMSTDHANHGEAAKTPSYAWVILAIVYLLSVSAAMFWFSIPPMADAIIPTYIVQLGPEAINANFGALMSHLAIGALIAALIALVLQNKIGIKWIMVLAALCILAGSAIAALSGTDYTMLVASRWVGGFGVGFVAVSATTAISMWFADDKRAFAMAIWATWVPVAMLIVFNIIAPMAMASDLHTTWWVIAIIGAIAFVLALVAYRMPSSDGQISTERTSLRTGLKFLANRQVIALMMCMFFYTFVCNCFTTYNVSFFTSELGMDSGFANLIASIASACGIIAPLFGAISDKIRANRKYLMIVAGAIAYVLACVLGFKDMGTVAFVLYMVFMVLANAILVATIRPMMPMLIGRGGFTAVTIGLAAITFLEFFGQIFTNFFGSAVDAFGWAQASWIVAVPIAVLMVISAFLVKPSKEER